MGDGWRGTVRRLRSSAGVHFSCTWSVQPFPSGQIDRQWRRHALGRAPGHGEDHCGVEAPRREARGLIGRSASRIPAARAVLRRRAARQGVLAAHGESEEEIDWLRIGAALPIRFCGACSKARAPAHGARAGQQRGVGVGGLGGTTMFSTSAVPRWTIPPSSCRRSSIRRARWEKGDVVFCELSALWGLCREVLARSR